MTPAALSLIMTTYSGAQRASGLALWGAVGSLGIAAGVAGRRRADHLGRLAARSSGSTSPSASSRSPPRLTVLPKDAATRPALVPQFDLPGAAPSSAASAP